MKLNTRNFGEIEIDEEKIIHFPEGLPAFDNERQFVIINTEEEENPFAWLQSVTNSDLTFVVIDPFTIYTDYDIVIPENALEKLKIKDKKDVIIFSVVVISQDIDKTTSNLQAPIIINMREMLGKQVILDDPRYSTKHYIFQQNKEVRGV